MTQPGCVKLEGINSKYSLRLRERKNELIVKLISSEKVNGLAQFVYRELTIGVALRSQSHQEEEEGGGSRHAEVEPTLQRHTRFGRETPSAQS